MLMTAGSAGLNKNSSRTARTFGIRTSAIDEKCQAFETLHGLILMSLSSTSMESGIHVPTTQPATVTQPSKNPRSLSHRSMLSRRPHALAGGISTSTSSFMARIMPAVSGVDTVGMRLLRPRAASVPWTRLPTENPERRRVTRKCVIGLVGMWAGPKVVMMTRVQRRCGRLRYRCELSVDEISGLVSEGRCE